MLTKKFIEDFGDCGNTYKIDVKALDTLIGGFEIIGIEPYFGNIGDQYEGVCVYVKNKNSEILRIDLGNDDEKKFECLICTPSWDDEGNPI